MKAEANVIPKTRWISGGMKPLWISNGLAESILISNFPYFSHLLTLTRTLIVDRCAAQHNTRGNLIEILSNLAWLKGRVAPNAHTNINAQIKVFGVRQARVGLGLMLEFGQLATHFCRKIFGVQELDNRFVKCLLFLFNLSVCMAWGHDEMMFARAFAAGIKSIADDVGSMLPFCRRTMNKNKTRLKTHLWSTVSSCCVKCERRRVYERQRPNWPRPEQPYCKVLDKDDRPLC